MVNWVRKNSCLKLEQVQKLDTEVNILGFQYAGAHLDISSKIKYQLLNSLPLKSKHKPISFCSLKAVNSIFRNTLKTFHQVTQMSVGFK